MMSEYANFPSIDIEDFARWLCDRKGYSFDDETGVEQSRHMWEADAIICEVLRRAGVS